MFIEIRTFITILAASILFYSKAYADEPLINCQIHEKSAKNNQSIVDTIDPIDFEDAVFLIDCGGHYSIAFSPVKHGRVCVYPTQNTFNKAQNKKDIPEYLRWSYVMTVIKPDNTCPKSNLDQYTFVHNMTAGTFYELYGFTNGLTADEKQLDYYLRDFKNKDEVIPYYNSLKKAVHDKHALQLVEALYLTPNPLSPSVIVAIIVDKKTGRSWRVPLDFCMDGSFCVVDSLNNSSRK